MEKSKSNSVLKSKRPATKKQVKSSSKNQVFRSDRLQIKKLLEAGKSAVSNAIKESKKLGLTITYIKDGYLINEFPDGRKENITKLKPVKVIPTLKKGVILHAKK
jgi:hypothetical protein